MEWLSIRIICSFLLKNRLESLRKLKTSLQADVQKYQAYMNNLESHSAILDQKLNGLDEEISRVGKYNQC